MRKIINYIVVLCLAFLVKGCTQLDVGDAKERMRTELIYCVADNNLSSEITKMAEEIANGWQPTGNKCVLYIDALDAPPKLVTINDAPPYIQTLEEYPEENAASPVVFSRVVARVKELFPAASYGLIMASHGSGWLPKGTLSNPTHLSMRSIEYNQNVFNSSHKYPATGCKKTIGYDRNDGVMMNGDSEMELTELTESIEDDAFDYIIFEACLMSGVEVAYALRNKTNYILASSAELLVPGFIPIYANAHRKLMNTAMPLADALKGFAVDYYNYIELQEGPYRSATLSLIDTKELSALACQMRMILPTTLINDVSDISSLQYFDRPGSYGDKTHLPRYFDLGAYVESRVTPQDFRTFEELLSQIIIWKRCTPKFLLPYNGFTITRHSGLTTYIPQKEFLSLNEAYTQTAWYKATSKNKK